jgi:aryl-alcohol dehydrogenase-like predicted oxidoreductase
MMFCECLCLKTLMNFRASKLILGTAQFGLNYGINNSKGKTPIKEALKILDYCKNEGIKALDTAGAYGSSEKVIGDLMLKYFAEDNFAITTKFKYKQGCDLDFLTLQSLKTLKRSTIETLLFHSFDDYLRYSSHSKPREVHRRGVSVYANTEISQVIDDPEVEVIQCPFNLLDNESKRTYRVCFLGIERVCLKSFLL